MQDLSTWEGIFIVMAILAVAVFFFPGAKRTLERSKNAPKDWMGLLIPIVVVIAFVFLLIQMV